MSATGDLTRGMDVIDTGVPLSVPVGGATLGRIFNVLGEPIDNLGPVDNSTTFPIHRSTPAFIQLDTKLSIFETEIKVVDLLAPYRRSTYRKDHERGDQNGTRIHLRSRVSRHIALPLGSNHNQN
ncbi:hypothetical protein L1987_75592 [Smallanthus sonchifolius]|uniref:Uncharacterized protein n=1 Tax=Smallanthus sonchifolius TaxID=185202 RepID=A0ACB9A741_9ASTR|nr:hypothetical protein L1987_75592 [Smallanthus sonchifolius]